MSTAEVRGIKAVVIGGGTGSFTVLSQLKHYIPDITAIVNMVDDGGSTGVLRDEYGVLPPGDIRQCLVALSSSPELMRDLFNYRFAEGSLSGHAFGNVFLTALEKITGDFNKAVEMAEHVLQIQGRVIPVTTKNTQLIMHADTKIVGQYAIETQSFDQQKRPTFSLKPKATLEPAAYEAIKQADLIVVGPGNLYSSLVPTLLVQGMSEALRETKATIIYNCNLVTKPGQTEGFSVVDFADEIERIIGYPVLEYVIYSNARPSKSLLERYAKDDEQWVEYDESTFADKHYKAIGADIISKKPFKKDPNDTFPNRTLIRHDSDKLARTIMGVYFTKS